MKPIKTHPIKRSYKKSTRKKIYKIRRRGQKIQKIALPPQQQSQQSMCNTWYHHFCKCLMRYVNMTINGMKGKMRIAIRVQARLLRSSRRPLALVVKRAKWNDIHSGTRSCWQTGSLHSRLQKLGLQLEYDGTTHVKSVLHQWHQVFLHQTH